MSNGTTTNYLVEATSPFIDCDAWCQTEKIEWADSTPYTFVWSIKNFSAREDNPGDSIESASFFVPFPHSSSLYTEWKLYLKFNIDSLSVMLAYRGEEFMVNAKYKISLLNSNKTRQNIVHSSGVEYFDMDMNCETDYKHIIDNRTPSGDLLPNNCLYIVCDLTMFGAETTVEGKKNAEVLDGNCSTGETQLSRDLQEAFAKNESSDSDVVINCGQKVFNCHKFILKARSPVFNAMFQADMKEGNSREVNIDNIDPKVLEDMLHFIYTGKIPNNDELAKDLLVAANYYQLEKLKTTCEENLCMGLERNNCIEFLVFADTYAATKLRKRSLEMAAKNLSVLLKTHEWKEDLLNNPLLKDEIMECALTLKVDQWI